MQRAFGLHSEWSLSWSLSALWAGKVPVSGYCEVVCVVLLSVHDWWQFFILLIFHQFHSQSLTGLQNALMFFELEQNLWWNIIVLTDILISVEQFLTILSGFFYRDQSTVNYLLPHSPIHSKLQASLKWFKFSEFSLHFKNVNLETKVIPTSNAAVLFCTNKRSVVYFFSSMQYLACWFCIMGGCEYISCQHFRFGMVFALLLIGVKMCVEMYNFNRSNERNWEKKLIFQVKIFFLSNLQMSADFDERQPSVGSLPVKNWSELILEDKMTFALFKKNEVARTVSWSSDWPRRQT